MEQRDIVRVLGSVVVAGTGAGLALGGAALTGNLSGSTTIAQIATAPASPPVVPSPAGGRELSVQQIYRLDAPGVVQITSAVPGKPRPPLASDGSSLGSGFVIDKAGHIVTSNRVLGAARNLQVSFSGSDELDAVVVGKDPTTDVALLQINAHSRSLSPLPLGDSDEVQVGDPVVAIGNELSLSRTATVGIVSAVQRGIDPPSANASARGIQTDAEINRGNSGGPLINTRGQVIGVSSQAVTTSVARASAGMGFAIPIDIVKSVVAQLIDTGKVEHSFLGIEALPVTPSLARTFSLPCDYGLLIQRVTPRSAAADASLRAGRNAVVVAGEAYRLGGDIIVAANGEPITSEAGLRNVIQTMKPGDHLALRLWRGKHEETVRVTLGRPPG
jgi:S1-C subfamily serine protease